MKRLILRLLGSAYRMLRHTRLIHLPVAKWLYYRLYSWTRPQALLELEVEGVRMQIDPRDEGIASFFITTGTYEPFEVDVIRRLIPKGGNVADIGANIGYYTLIASKCVGEQGCVYCFEPAPGNFDLLRQNVELNGFGGRVRAEQIAIGDKAGQCKLFLCEHNLGDHRILPDAAPGRQSVDVALQRLDDVLPAGTRLDLIKMDIQGAEYLAMAGMQRVLDDNADLMMIMEFWPPGIIESGHQPQEFIEFLAKCGFENYVIDEQQQQLVKTTDAELMQASLGDQHLNILSVRGAARERVEQLPMVVQPALC